MEAMVRRTRGLEEATGQKVVGVSVCWDFQDYEDELLAPWMGGSLGMVGMVGMVGMGCWILLLFEETKKAKTLDLWWWFGGWMFWKIGRLVK